MASKFAELYKFCQDLKPKISRKRVREKTLELTGERVREIRVSLDIARCRGFFVSAKNTAHPFVKSTGINVIVTAKGMDYDWERFVYTKELMHLFDEPAEQTSTPQQFEQLLTEFAQPSVQLSPQSRSETKAFWMALASLCPESYRQEYKLQIGKGHMDHYAVSLQLAIPQSIVPALFADSFEPNIQYLIK